VFLFSREDEREALGAGSFITDSSLSLIAVGFFFLKYVLKIILLDMMLFLSQRHDLKKAD